MKIKTFLLGMAMLLGIASALAQGGTDRGITWRIEHDTTLIISGDGKMPDYNQGIFCIPYCAPWSDYRLRITSIIIEEGITNIGAMAFFDCYRLSLIDIPSSVTKIGMNAFTYAGPPSIILPEGVEIIDVGAFIESILVSISLPSSVVMIKEYAFSGCRNLASVTNLNPVPISIVPDVFDVVNVSACTLYVPMSSVAAYQAAEVWKEFNIVGIDVGIDEMGTGNPLLIYPNPTTGYCTITIPDEFLHEPVLTLLVYDISGRLIREIPVENDGEKFSMNLGLKAQGTYMTVLSNGKKSYRGKVVFE